MVTRKERERERESVWLRALLTAIVLLHGKWLKVIQTSSQVKFLIVQVYNIGLIVNYVLHAFVPSRFPFFFIFDFRQWRESGNMYFIIINFVVRFVFNLVG